MPLVLAQYPPMKNTLDTYYDMFPDFFDKKPTDLDVCTDDLPCPAASMTFLADGKDGLFEPMEGGDEDLSGLLKHYALNGLNKTDIVELGRMFAKAMKHSVGIDFTKLMDNAYLYGYTIPGVATLQSYYFGDKAKIRVTTVTVKEKAEYLNRPVSSAGWTITFHKDFVCHGASADTIPAGSKHAFNSMIFRPCDGSNQYMQCKNILGQDTVFITEMSEFAFKKFGPDNSEAINFNSHNTKFGYGDRLVIRTQVNDHIDYRSVAIFPDN